MSPDSSRPAVKISVSLPEALKLELDRYADEHNLSVSQTIQRALEALFHPPVPDPDPEEPGPDPDVLQLVQMLNRDVQTLQNDLAQTRQALTWTQQVLEQHRECLASLAPLTQLAGVALTLPPSMLE